MLLFACRVNEQEIDMESLADKLKRMGFKPVTDSHCVVCQKPINSEVDGLYCSVQCQAWDANVQHEEQT